MQIENTTDKIEVILGSNITTNQLHFNVSYNDITPTSVTPVKNVGITNNTTAVDLVPSPSAGNKRQLKYCNIFNSDSLPAIVTIRINYNGTTRIVLSTTLQINDYIQYTTKSGWKVFNMNGALKLTNAFTAPSELRSAELQLTNATNGSLAIASNNTMAQYIGKATGNYTYITIAPLVLGGIATGFAEMGIYKGRPSLGSTLTLTRLGYIDATQMISTTGQNQYKMSAIDIKGCQEGDDLWILYASSGSAFNLRATSATDDIGAGYIQTCGAARPSLSSSINTTAILSGSTNTCPFLWWSAV
jgi:hypothetical protein